MRVLSILSFALSTCVTLPALAQPAAPLGATAPDPGRLAEAKVHFERGVELLQRKAWDPALAEFLKSRELSPRESSTEDAAICLRELHRYDEALEMYERLFAEFPNLEPDVRARAQRSMEEVRALVGSVALTGADGARVSVDGRDRGVYRSPVPVAAGTHVVRVSRTGFLPFETRIEVVGGQRAVVEAKLDPLTSGAAAAPLQSSDEPGPAASSGRRTVGWVLIGVGGAAAIAAGITGAIILSRNGEIESECPARRCSPPGVSDVSTSNALLVGNGIAWGLAAAGIGAGAILLATSKSHSTGLVLAPRFGGASLVARSAF